MNSKVAAKNFTKNDSSHDSDLSFESNESYPKLQPEKAVKPDQRANNSSFSKSKSRSRMRAESPEWRWAYAVSSADP
jgi:hypothetical protein